MTLTQLQAAFAGREWPDFSQLQAADDGYHLHLRVQADNRWLEGHFPGQPVLAGVVQTHWAAELSRALFPLGEGFQRIDNLKFQSVILPNQSLVLRLIHQPESRAVKFSYASASETFSEGKLVF